MTENKTQDQLAPDHDYWGEHPDHPLDDWRYEVQNGDTRMGYWEWVMARLESSEST